MFRFGVVLLLDWLPIKAAEPSLPKDVWFFRRSHFPALDRLVRGGPKLEANVRCLNPSATGHTTIHRKFNLYVLFAVVYPVNVRRVRDSIPRRPSGRILGEILNFRPMSVA